MFKLFRIHATATGNEYELPLEAIIAHRMQFLVAERKLAPAGDKPEDIQAFMQGPIQSLQDEVNAEMAVEGAAFGWASQIPWNFAAPHSRMVKFNAPDCNLTTDMVWTESYDEPKPVEDLAEGVHPGSIPIDFFLALLQKNKNNISMSVMQDGEGRKNCLVIIFRGDHDQVEACEALIGQLAAQMRQFPDGKPAGKQYPH